MSPRVMTAAGRAPAKARRTAAPAHGRPTAPRRAPSVPRRVSGPVPRPARSAAPRVLVFVRSLPDHSLLDRLVRGRWWIPLLGVLLAGLVFTQVEVLRLNASMGRSLSQNSALEVRNQALRASVAELSDDARIERLAAGMGMTMPAPTGLSFIGSGASLTRAIENIHPPSSTYSSTSSSGSTSSSDTSSSGVSTGSASSSANQSGVSGG